jgi:hypothetical protein
MAVGRWERMKRHQLYEINLERLTAFCTVCGYTEIVLPKTRSDKRPKHLCVARAREKREKQRQKLELAREEGQAGASGRQRHSLSNIDPEAMTAICSICGPTNIWKHSNSYKGRTYYLCGTRRRTYLRKYSRAHRAGRSTNPHALSQVNEEAIPATGLSKTFIGPT